VVAASRARVIAENTIDHFVMAITSAEARCWHAAPVQWVGASWQNQGEMVMIDALAFALIAVALGLPALIMATMLGSKLNFVRKPRGRKP
jgi:hypothetical protein